MARTSNLMVVYYVNDMTRAIEFYRDILEMTVISQSPGWSMLSCGSSMVGLHILSPGSGETVAQHAGLNLEVEDLELAAKQVAQGGGRLLAIREAELPTIPVRLAVLQDTEGNVFELRQYISVA